MLPILREPNPTLRQPSAPFDLQTLLQPETQTWLDELTETMQVADGIGIAAPQTGTNKRVIIVQTGEGPKAFMNPKFFSASLRKVESEEGCLSVPGVYGIVKRHKSVKVKAVDREGKKIMLKADGLEAIIFQHEIDHLDGVLFIDKVERYTHPSRL
ncbi:peptide deformylase [Candidatus Uhrbacteria bacterium]|nr:peptide deformylase [Candidatus Uhrbacteria bacterium]